MFKRYKRLLITGVTFLFFFLIPFFVERTDLLDLFFLFFLYMILSQSWNILGGYTGQISLGHAAFFGIGAIITRLLVESGVVFAPAFLAGGIAALILAGIIGLPALRLRGIYFAIGTLGLALIMKISMGNILPGVSFMPVKQLSVYSLTPRYYLALALAVVSVSLVYFLSVSKIGLAMLTVRENEDAASAAGINVFAYKVLALGISSLLAGFAGGLYTYYYPSFYYHIPFDLYWCFDPLLIVFIGGVGTVIGPIIGSVLYVVLRQVFALTLGGAHVIVFGILFILIVILLPGGLIDVAAKFRSLTSQLGAMKSIVK